MSAGSAGHGIRFVKVFVLALVYFACGKFSLLLAIPPGYATAVWPPAGIALAALLVYGRGLWPGILLGSFLVNIGTSLDASSWTQLLKSAAVAAGIGAGASVQAVLAAGLIERFVRGPLELVRDADIFKFLFLGGPASCLLNATMSVSLLFAAGLIAGSQYAFSWWTWWIGDSIGVAVFAPFVLLFAAQPGAVWRRRRLRVAVPLALAFALVAGFFVRTSTWEDARIRSEFENRAVAISEALRKELSASMEVLRAVQGLVQTSQDVQAGPFRQFVLPFLERHPAIEAVSWNPVVVGGDRGEFEEAARREIPSFRFTEKSPSGALIAAGERGEYVVVRYIEPFAANGAALGFDVSSEPVRVEALRRARETAQPSATAPINLVQDSRQPGMLVFVPAISAAAGRSSSPAPQPSGYVAGVFRLDQLIARAVGAVPHDGVGITVRDRETSAELFREGTGSGTNRQKTGLVWQTTIAAMGRAWFIDYEASPDLLRASSSWRAWTVLATGLLFTAVLGALCLSMTGREVVIERLGAERLAELSKANDALLREVRGREVAEATLHELVESTRDAIVLLDDSGSITGWNRGAQEAFGYSGDEIQGAPLLQLISERPGDSPSGTLQDILSTPSPHVSSNVSAYGRRKDGSDFPIELTISSWTAGGKRRFGAILRDTTSRSELESALRQSQKMEAVGRLAGGVAHDFNNLITVISGCADMLLSEEKLPEDARNNVDMIVSAGQRAANLTRQLLAFSRKQILQPTVLDPNEILASLERMLRPVIGEDIDLRVVRGSTVGRIFADRGQIEQVIVNLVVNARDAMPDGGKLTITTGDAIQTGRLGRLRGLAGDAPGRYVVISVRDTGVGMDEKTQSRIFEPFFTTKGPGKGTGLGLATVYGIIKQSGGHIEVESKPGRGSCFTLLIPRVEGEPPRPESASKPAIPNGQETILLVEDDASVRMFTANTLRQAGYLVLAAESPEAALPIARSHAVDMILTDTVMPGMNGLKLVDELRRCGVDAPALYMSGYSEDAIVRHGVLEPGIAFLAKPFLPYALLAKVREVLDQSGYRDTPQPALS